MRDLNPSSHLSDDAGLAELIGHQRERIEWLKSLDRPTDRSEQVLSVLLALNRQMNRDSESAASLPSAHTVGPRH